MSTSEDRPAGEGNPSGEEEPENGPYFVRKHKRKSIHRETLRTASEKIPEIVEGIEEAVDQLVPMAKALRDAFENGTEKEVDEDISLFRRLAEAAEEEAGALHEEVREALTAAAKAKANKRILVRHFKQKAEYYEDEFKGAKNSLHRTARQVEDLKSKVESLEEEIQAQITDRKRTREVLSGRIEECNLKIRELQAELRRREANEEVLEDVFGGLLE